MNTKDYLEYFDELDNEDKLKSGLGAEARRPRRERVSRKLARQDGPFRAAQDDSRRSFKFTYKAARFEEWWLLDSLGPLYEHRWISDVLRRVKGGKEASVYECSPGAGVEAARLAAKVYRPRSLRNLKNDAQYRLGRTDLDEDGHGLWREAEINAIAKRTRYGEEVRHQSWIAYEYTTMELLHAAGADVPKPYAKEKNAILMEFIGEAGAPAPPLSQIRLARDEAARLFERAVHNLDLLLAKDRIHGDLSAYNILYWQGNLTLIDFPQVVLPESNPAAWAIFLRDVTRVCQYFAAQGVPSDPRALAAELWTAHGHRVIEKVHPKYLDAEKPEDRQVWEKQE